VGLFLTVGEPTKDFSTPVPELQGCPSVLCGTTPSATSSLYLQRESKVGQEYDIHVHHTPNTTQQTGENIKKRFIIFLLFKTVQRKLQYLLIFNRR